MSSIFMVLADFAVGLYGLSYGFIGRLLDPYFMCASILRFRISLRLLLCLQIR